MLPTSSSISPLGGGLEPPLGLLPTSPRPDSLASRQGEFAAILARGRNKVADSPDDAKAIAREGAQEFVAITLVQPLLKQLRENSKAAAPFKPSSAELQFRGMMDAQIAQRIVRAASFPLVDVVARSLERGAAAKTDQGATE